MEDKAQEKAEAKAAEEKTSSDEEAKTLGISRSKISMAGFKDKDKPEKMLKEATRQEKLADKRVANRVAKTKAKAAIKPIDKRKKLLQARFKAVRTRKRGVTYTNKIIEAYTEEYNLIINNPKSWLQQTANGTKPYAPGNVRKKTAKELLESMDLDTE